jgi:hypothetical protein
VASAGAANIRCEGPFGKDTSHAKLVAVFGAKNVVFQPVDGPDGVKMNATVIFPSDPKRRVEVLWQDENARKKPGSIVIGSQSTWRARGFRIGETIADVEKVNGKPFKLSGFDWDYGGRVTDWQDGKLSKPQPGGCLLGVDFVHPEDSPEANLAKVTGDGEFLSDNADMRAVEPFVGTLNISYPKR